MNYHYGTNIQGSQWIKKYGAIYSKTIPNWKTTTYSKLFQEHCNCIGIVSTTKPLDDEIIKKYDLIKLNETQNNLVDSFINFRIEVENLNEMTPKEALNQLNNFISREKHIDSERNKTINECVDTLNQTLDYFEQLEKENQELKEKISKFEKPILYMCRDRRSRELERLRLLELANTYNVPILLNDFETVKELEKLKKVIDILKDKLELAESVYSKLFDTQVCYLLCNKTLTQQEYDLLKEVLENV